MADNQKMILNLFGSMQEALFLGDPLDNGEFVSFLQPGQFVSNNLLESGNSDDMAIQSDIANILIDSSYVNQYSDTTFKSSKELLGSVNQVYEDIMLHPSLPFVPMSTGTLQEISDLQTWIANNYANYSLYEGRYFDAVEAYSFEEHKQLPDDVLLQRLAQAEQDASDNWQTFGLQGLYDSKVARLVYLTAPDPTTFWKSLSDRMMAQKQRGPQLGEYYQTFLIPPISEWANAGWATFEQTVSESDTYDYSKSTSWSGGVSASFGLWSVGGGSSGSNTFTQSESDVSSVGLKFDYLRVRIDRRWLTPDVFGYKFWTWDSGYFQEYVCDGGNLNVTPPVRPVGRMPVLVNYLIVVRNVELTASFSHNDMQNVTSSLSGSVSVGFGPFSASGSYQESSGTKTTNASYDGVTFRIPQPQIIARSGILLPKSPDPAPTLKWQEGAWLPKASDMERIEAIREADYKALVQKEQLMEARAEANAISELVFQQKKRAIVGGH